MQERETSPSAPTLGALRFYLDPRLNTVVFKYLLDTLLDNGGILAVDILDVDVARQLALR